MRDAAHAVRILRRTAFFPVRCIDTAGFYRRSAADPRPHGEKQAKKPEKSGTGAWRRRKLGLQCACRLDPAQIQINYPTRKTNSHGNEKESRRQEGRREAGRREADQGSDEQVRSGRPYRWRHRSGRERCARRDGRTRRPKRKGINPFTGQETTFAAKPATVKVKARPMKKLKDAATA
jgi:Bacterial DNA-binding protein